VSYVDEDLDLSQVSWWELLGVAHLFFNAACSWDTEVLPCGNSQFRSSFVHSKKVLTLEWLMDLLAKWKQSCSLVIMDCSYAITTSKFSNFTRGMVIEFCPKMMDRKEHDLVLHQI